MSESTERPASGNDEFDRALDYIERFREEEAIDWFEIAATEAPDPRVRRSAAAYVAGLLLTRGRPWEVDVWADMVRSNDDRPDLGNLLEASAKLQLDDVGAARTLLAEVHDVSDPWFPATMTTARIARAHVAYIDEDVEAATQIVLDVFADDPFAPDVWDALARLCGETDFDPSPFIDQVPDDKLLRVLASLRMSSAEGVDRIAQLVWDKNPGDARVLALVPSFAPRLEAMRALEWSARLRAEGMGRLCPLLERANDDRVGAPERVRCAALAHATFGDTGARAPLEAATRLVTDDELPVVMREVWSIAPMLADSIVVEGAVTPARALALTAVLFEGGAPEEAYAVLVHGLSLDAAEDLTTDLVVRLLPLSAIEGLAAEAERRGEQDVAGILEAVAVVSADLS